MPPKLQQDLPKIICIHGRGTNGAIFHLQSHRVVQALQHKFCFIFVDAPFSSPAGPGVLPAFADLGPFLRWHWDDNGLDMFDITHEEMEKERDQVRALLARSLEDEEVVGVMAFSEGTRVATGLLLDGNGLGSRLKFAILFSPMIPALLLDGDSGKKNEAAVSSRLVTPKQVLEIPSIHFQGSHDPWSADGAKLKETYYAAGLARIVKFTGGHQVPAGSKEAAEVAAWVAEVFKT